MATRHVLMKAKLDGTGHAQQVFSDKFSDYGYANYLRDWFEKYNGDYGYWLDEVEA